MKAAIILSLAALLSVALSQLDEDGTKRTFDELLTSTRKFYIASKILYLTGTTTIVAHSPNITVLLPTNYAFRATGRELGCGSAGTLDEAVQCITDKFTTQEIARILSYHILLTPMDSADIMAKEVLKTSIGLPVYWKRDKFVDQMPQYSNAELVRGLTDLQYENGFAHAVNRVLLPFTTKLPDDPCDVFEFPLSVRNGSFIPIYRLEQAVRKCPKVREATVACGVQKADVCATGRAERTLVEGITVGSVVAAVKFCASVRRAVVDDCDAVSLIA